MSLDTRNFYYLTKNSFTFFIIKRKQNLQNKQVETNCWNLKLNTQQITTSCKIKYFSAYLLQSIVIKFILPPFPKNCIKRKFHQTKICFIRSLLSITNVYTRVHAYFILSFTARFNSRGRGSNFFIPDRNRKRGGSYPISSVLVMRAQKLVSSRIAMRACKHFAGKARKLHGRASEISRLFIFVQTHLPTPIAFQPREFRTRHFRPDKTRRCRNSASFETRSSLQQILLSRDFHPNILIRLWWSFFRLLIFFFYSFKFISERVSSSDQVDRSLDTFSYWRFLLNYDLVLTLGRNLNNVEFLFMYEHVQCWNHKWWFFLT